MQNYVNFSAIDNFPEKLISTLALFSSLETVIN